MGPVAPDGPYPWYLPPQGGPSTDRVTDAETRRWEVVIFTPRGGYAGGGAGYDQYLHCSPSEQNVPISHNSSEIGAMFGGRASPGVTGTREVSGTGDTGMGGIVGGGEAGRSSRDGDGGGATGWGGGRA